MLDTRPLKGNVFVHFADIMPFDLICAVPAPTLEGTCLTILTVLARVACVLLLAATGEVRAVSERVLVARAAILTRIAARSAHLRFTGQNR